MLSYYLRLSNNESFLTTYLCYYLIILKMVILDSRVLASVELAGEPGRACANLHRGQGGARHPIEQGRHRTSRRKI